MIDFRLPGLAGADLALAIHKENPAQRITMLMDSGFVGSSIRRKLGDIPILNLQSVYKARKKEQRRSPSPFFDRGDGEHLLDWVEAGLKATYEVWNALIPAPEVKDLYDARYAELMKGSSARILGNVLYGHQLRSAPGIFERFDGVFGHEFPNHQSPLPVGCHVDGSRINLLHIFRGAGIATPIRAQYRERFPLSS